MKYKEKAGYEFREYKLGDIVMVDGIKTMIIGLSPESNKLNVLIAVDSRELRHVKDWEEETQSYHISCSMRSIVYYLDVPYSEFTWVRKDNIQLIPKSDIDKVILLSNVITDVRERIKSIEIDIKNIADAKLDKPQDHECNIKVNIPIKLNSKYSILALLEMAHKQLRVEKEVLDECENQLKAMLKEDN